MKKIRYKLLNFVMFMKNKNREKRVSHINVFANEGD